MHRRIGASVLAGAAVLASGCQTPWGGSLWPRPTSSASAAVPAANQQRFDGLAGERPAAASPTGLGGTHSAPSENFLLASWKKTTAAVTGGAAAAKASLPEDDPLRLDRVPRKIGPEVYVGAARLLENQGKFDEAEAKYREALKVAPRDFAALIGLARLYDRQGQGAKALEMYRSAAKAHPENPLVFNDLGLCYRRQRQSKPAIEAFRKAVALKPDEAKYRNNLAAALVEAGQPDEALQQLLAVHTPAAAHYNLAFLLQQQGDRQAAANHLHQALQHDPTLAPARQMLAQLGQAGEAAHGTAAASEGTNGSLVGMHPEGSSAMGTHPTGRETGSESASALGSATASVPSSGFDNGYLPLADPQSADYAAAAGQAPAATTPVVAAASPSPSLPTIEYGPQQGGGFVPTPAMPLTPTAPAAGGGDSASQPSPAVQPPAPPSYHIGDDGPIPAEAPGPARYSSAAWVFPASGPPGSTPPGGGAAFGSRPAIAPGQPRTAGHPLPPVD